MENLGGKKEKRRKERKGRERKDRKEEKKRKERRKKKRIQNYVLIFHRLSLEHHFELYVEN